MTSQTQLAASTGVSSPIHSQPSSDTGDYLSSPDVSTANTSFTDLPAKLLAAQLGQHNWRGLFSQVLSQCDHKANPEAAAVKNVFNNVIGSAPFLQAAERNLIHELERNFLSSYLSK